MLQTCDTWLVPSFKWTPLDLCNSVALACKWAEDFDSSVGMIPVGVSLRLYPMLYALGFHRGAFAELGLSSTQLSGLEFKEIQASLERVRGRTRWKVFPGAPDVSSEDFDVRITYHVQSDTLRQTRSSILILSWWTPRLFQLRLDGHHLLLNPVH